jgi:hypothetical protein
MQRPTFDELFSLLSAAPLSSADLNRLREWFVGLHDPAECLALIEAAAAGRVRIAVVPACTAAVSPADRRAFVAWAAGRFKTWLVRFNGVASRYLANYSGWQRLLDARELHTPALWLRAAVRQA